MIYKIVYASIYTDRIVARNVDDDREIERLAKIPFSHPRMLVGSFSAAQICLKEAVTEAKGSGFSLATVIVVQPMDRLEGGLSQVEERLLHELAMGAGAYKALVWVGQRLSDDEVKAKVKALLKGK